MFDGIFLKRYTTQFSPMRNKNYKLYYDLSIIKDTLLGEESSFQVFLSFRRRDFPEIPHPELSTLALQTR
jgi:transposase